MSIVYENKKEGIQVFENPLNGRFYPRQRVQMSRFLSFMGYWSHTCMGQFNNKPLSVSTKEQAIALGKFLKDDPEAKKLGMNLKQDVLDRIAQMRVQGLKVEIDQTTQNIKKNSI